MSMSNTHGAEQLVDLLHEWRHAAHALHLWIVSSLFWCTDQKAEEEAVVAEQKQEGEADKGQQPAAAFWDELLKDGYTGLQEVQMAALGKGKRERRQVNTTTVMQYSTRLVCVLICCKGIRGMRTYSLPLVLAYWEVGKYNCTAASALILCLHRQWIFFSCAQLLRELRVAKLGKGNDECCRPVHHLLCPETAGGAYATQFLDCARYSSAFCGM